MATKTEVMSHISSHDIRDLGDVLSTPYDAIGDLRKQRARGKKGKRPRPKSVTDEQLLYIVNELVERLESLEEAHISDLEEFSRPPFWKRWFR